VPSGGTTSRVARPTPAAVAELVRLPAVLSVPGDSLLGAAAATGATGAGPGTLRRVGLAASSSLLYLAGMALNDYADRHVDAVERPHRPLPSGRVPPRFALGLAQGLTVAGVGMAAAVGGRRALAVAVPLAGAVWAYDLALKSTPLGPVAMAACRSLDVLVGASAGPLRPALAPAAVIGAHTLTVTAVSRFETTGATAAVPAGAAGATAAVTLAAALLAARRAPRGRGRRSVLAPAVMLAGYAGPVGAAARQAWRDPAPGALQRLVGTGVLGVVPLQAGLISGCGDPVTGALVGSLWPLARRLARKRSVT
jgi:hypothetical protein